MQFWVILFLSVLSPSFAVQASTLTVFAAASLTTALQEIEAEFEATTGHEVAISVAGSSALARQIQRGAPADVFLSASPEWMDVLDRQGLIRSETRRDLLKNQLVLVAHDLNAPAVMLDEHFDLKGLIGQSRLAMALVDAVPAGMYGQSALRQVGLWEQIASRVAQTDHVRAALMLVVSGEASHGIVYATDAVAESRVRVIAEFPKTMSPRIVYPVAALRRGDQAVQDEFLRFLTSESAQRAFARQGFEVAF